MKEWLKKTFSESPAVSASRQFFFILLVAVCFGLVKSAIEYGITVAWATVACGIATTLATVWWKGKGNSTNK